MSAASVDAAPRGRSATAFGRRSAAAVLASPVLTLLVLFAAPLAYLTWVSFSQADITGDGSFTLDNYAEVLGEPIYRSVFVDTIVVSLTAMVILFAVFQRQIMNADINSGLKD